MGRILFLSANLPTNTAQLISLDGIRQRILDTEAKDKEVTEAMNILEKEGPSALTRALKDWEVRDGLLTYRGKIYIPNLLPPGKAFIVKPARLRLSVLTVKLYLLCLLLLLGPIVTFYPKEAHREMLGMAFTSAIFITAQFFALFFPTDPNVGYKFGCFSLRAEENVISLIRDGGEWRFMLMAGYALKLVYACSNSTQTRGRSS